jgi:DNA-binding NarL/FixJ family response regulator
MPTRIALIDMPRVLREIVKTTLDRDPEIEIVGEFSGAPIVEALERIEADLVIAGPTALHAQDVGVQLLERDNHVRVIAVRSDGRRSVIWEQLGELSPEGLVAVVKRAPGTGSVGLDR